MISILCAALSALLALSPGASGVPPRERIIARMLLIEVSQDGSLSRSSGSRYHGQCRRFQADSLEEAVRGFELEGFPGLLPTIPLEHREEEETGMPAGSVWSEALEGTVCAYDAVASFTFDPARTAKENLESAKAFLRGAQAGDVLQMIATYNSGARGTHTLMLSQPYDARKDMLYWCDSNFSNTRIDGVKYGYARAHQAWAMKDVAAWISSSENTGATLYRLRNDIVEIDGVLP